MKKITIFVCLVILIIAILATVPILFLARNVGAEQEIKLEMEDDTLVVLRVLKKYPGVPKGVDEEVAYEATKKGKIDYISNGSETKYELAFPARSIKILEKKRIIYQNDKWDSKVVALLIEEKGSSLSVTLFVIVFPFLGIIMVTFSSRMKRIKSKKLFIFYLSLVGVIVITNLIHRFLGAYDSLAFGICLGGFTGTYIGLRATSIGAIENFNGIIIGLLTGACVGGSASRLISRTCVSVDYIIFIVFVCIFSDIVCRLILHFIPGLHAKRQV